MAIPPSLSSVFSSHYLWVRDSQSCCLPAVLAFFGLFSFNSLASPIYCDAFHPFSIHLSIHHILKFAIYKNHYLVFPYIPPSSYLTFAQSWVLFAHSSPPLISVCLSTRSHLILLAPDWFASPHIPLLLIHVSTSSWSRRVSFAACVLLFFLNHLQTNIVVDAYFSFQMKGSERRNPAHNKPDQTVNTTTCDGTVGVWARAMKHKVWRDTERQPYVPKHTNPVRRLSNTLFSFCFIYEAIPFLNSYRTRSPVWLAALCFFKV